MKKLEYIDGLKGIGALMVFFCHFVFAFYYGAYSLSTEHTHTQQGLEIALGRTPLNLFYNGNAAVCIFLVLSGFVLCLGYFHTRDSSRLKIGAAKRYFRLMPTILAVNAAIFLLMRLGLYRNQEAALLTHSEVWFAGFNQFAPTLKSLLGESLIGCFLWGSNAYNGVLWTIPYLFLGALLVYLTAWMTGGNRLRYLVYAAVLLTALATDIYLAGMLLGFVLCDIYCTQERLMELYQRLSLLPLLSFGAGVYLCSYPSIGSSQVGPLYLVLPPAYTVIYHMAGACLLTAGVLGSGILKRLFACRPFRFLGRISFSLYLLHFPVIATFSSWFFLSLHERLGYHLTAALNFVLTSLLVLAVSAASARWLEPLGRKLEDGAAALAGRGRE